ncbi:MAG TPA: hypothetical protein VHM70_17030 [Polyangiaceae bacterium]|jgi:hypothetical protein|nr:hypothetical protein [Polyangiaceae bacterium]
MELQIEGILETTLVGTIAALVLLSILFLFAGHLFVVDVAGDRGLPGRH